LTVKKDAVVITLTLKGGENLLGYYCGEAEATAELQASVLIYRPITISEVVYLVNNSPVRSYHTNLYCPYGGSLITIPYSDVTHRDIASEFFTMFYPRTLGELLMKEEALQKSYIDLYEYQNDSVILENTDSILLRGDDTLH
jgi:hypothetical protein